MFKFSAVSQISKKYIQKLNDWDLPLKDAWCWFFGCTANQEIDSFLARLCSVKDLAYKLDINGEI